MTLFVRALLFVAISPSPLLAQAATKAERPEFQMLQALRPCECYPASSSSKKYIDEGRKGLFGGRWKTYSCDFTCASPDGAAVLITGTQYDSYSWSESGKNFVCRGYEMEWMETPMSNREWGVYTIKGIRPFRAEGSKIPELEKWAASACR